MIVNIVDVSYGGENGFNQVCASSQAPLPASLRSRHSVTHTIASMPGD